MDTNSNAQLPATDDQELAKVLAGMNQQVDTGVPATDQSANDGLQYEESGVPPLPALEDAAAPTISTHDDSSILMQDVSPAPTESTPQTDTASIETGPALHEAAIAPAGDATAPALSPESHPELDALKKEALSQLRPLVDRLDLPAQEKFDTLLLIIRSTDDQALLPAAHEAAKLIEDEKKRAEALLDVIKEIDFFTHHTPAM